MVGAYGLCIFISADYFEHHCLTKNYVSLSISLGRRGKASQGSAPVKTKISEEIYGEAFRSNGYCVACDAIGGGLRSFSFDSIRYYGWGIGVDLQWCDENGMTKFLTVIVVNFNSGTRLEKCLAALSQQTIQDFDVVVVDNHSSDDSLNFQMPENLGVRVIKLTQNVGFAAANNHAVKAANTGWVAFLNPDAYARPDWVGSFVAAQKRYPDVDAFGSLQINALNPSLLDGAGDVYFAAGISYRAGFNHPIEDAPEEGECFSPCAAAAFYKKETFDQLGGFEENFFCYFEDVDLGFRLRLAGGRAVQLRDAVVYHEGSAITSQLSGFAVYHGHRNRLWTYIRNMPFVLLLITLPAQLLMSFLLVFYFAARGSGGPYLRSLRDGLAGLPRAFKERRQIQRTRKASVKNLAQAMTWSPIKFLRRNTDS